LWQKDAAGNAVGHFNVLAPCEDTQPTDFFFLFRAGLLGEDDHREARLLPRHEHCPCVSSSSWRLEDACARAAPDAWAKGSEARQHACVACVVASLRKSRS
jgi:hypothetical protein